MSVGVKLRGEFPNVVRGTWARCWLACDVVGGDSHLRMHGRGRACSHTWLSVTSSAQGPARLPEEEKEKIRKRE